MTETLVVDASVAIKWVVQEEGTEAALGLRSLNLVAPELILAECANILWKKAERAELTREAALLSAKLLERSGIEFVSLYGLSERTVALAIELGHPAYVAPTSPSPSRANAAWSRPIAGFWRV